MGKVILSTIAVLLVVFAVFVGACTGEPPIIPPVPETPVEPTADVSIPIGEFQNRPHIDVEMHAMVGGELTVTLGSNPTTGHQWLEEAKISDETIIRQVSHMFVGPGIEKPPGTSGEEVWTFEALQRGTTTILLEYCRWTGAGLWAVFITATIE